VDVFVHEREAKRSGLPYLAEGGRYRYRAVKDRGRFMAEEVAQL
jgi:cold shock CspA family protein